MAQKFCSNCQQLIPNSAQFCPYCGHTDSGHLTGHLLAQSLLDNRYIILQLVGQGGMGAVYQATDTRIQGRLCAIKEMSVHALPVSERTQAVQNFEQEARLLANLRHACLPQVHDFFQDGRSGRYYLVMDFVEGETLEAILNRQRTLPEDVVRAWGSQLCDVLQYLHQQTPPIIFRDLKPGNIMLDKNNQIKLIDFGIARFFKPMQTKDTQVIGTPGFAAPEQYGHGQTDTRSDIYGLGVTLLALLTGYDPAQSPFTLPEAIQLNPNVSPQMTAVIQRATEIMPDRRWQTTADMQKALTTGSLPPLKEGSAKKPWWLIGVFLLVVLLGFGAWALLREDEPTIVASSVSAPEVEVTRLLVVTSTVAPQEPVEEPEVIAAVLIETPTPTNVVMPTDSPSPTALPQPSATLPPSDTPIPAAPDRVVFQSNRDGDFEIYIINVDGSNLQQLTNNSNIDDKYPAVSPDGRRIAFQAKSNAERDSGWEIYVMDIDGRNQTRLTSDSNWDRLPTWSPDGRQIAFISDRGGQFAVYVMDANGQNVRQATNTGERDGHVSWSVNNQLAWNTGGDSSKTWRIVTSNADGRNLQQVAGNGNWSPEWSPDGRSIVFVSSRIGGDTNPAIFVMNDDGSNQRLVADGPGEDWGARWSNDGQYIIYTASPNSTDSIYMIPVNGGSPILITNRGSYPAWVNGR